MLTPDKKFHFYKNEIAEAEAYYRMRGSAYGAERSDISKQRKPRVLLVPDADFWAFYNISIQVEKYNNTQFDIEIRSIGINSKLVYENPLQLLVLAAWLDADIIHFFWRNEYLAVLDGRIDAYAASLGMKPEEFYETFVASRILSLGVYDHLYLEGEEMESRAPIFATLLDGYYTSSEKLFDIYSRLPGYSPPMSSCSDGVNTRHFHPKNLERFDSLDSRELVVGWVGNSGWMPEYGDIKGFHSILTPALELLREEGVSVRFHPADRAKGFIPHAAMPEYYSNLDILICVSKIEGTPNPVLEAMACGVPVISTDVGIVPEAFGPVQKEFILPERTPQALAKVIKKFACNPELCVRLSRENLERIQAWDWSIKAKKIHGYFQNLLTMRNRSK